MSKYLLRLMYRDVEEKELHNPLMHPFLLLTAAYGVALVFFANTAPVQATVLYVLTIAELPDAVVSIWGIVALIVTVLNIIGVMVRVRWLSRSVALGGVALWIYAFFLYALNGYILQLFIAAVPNMIFWFWYYYTIGKYHDREYHSSL